MTNSLTAIVTALASAGGPAQIGPPMLEAIDPVGLDAARLVAMLLFFAPLAYSPGPGNGYFAALGARVGVRGCWPALAGYHMSGWLITAALGVGLGASLLAHPSTTRVIGLTGGSWVTWLGARELRAAGAALGPHVDGTSAPVARAHGTDLTRGATPWGQFWAGVLVMTFNPKAYVIIGLVFAQFLRPARPAVAEVAVITTVFILNNLVAFLVWAAAGRLLSKALGGRRAGAVLALSLVAVGGWMVATAAAG